ncbi:MAG: CDP-diacylglycerol--glycerol-3-phosphate 3-phosphatidyltransferase [Gammaproteobacteria bacterium]|nr:CDP-diacylglycerol--glycerol-3-phosphate 3-phosphatidyltransferase [Gammaproteobacteria bacterium]
MYKNLPNLLTVLRIFLIPIFVVFFYLPVEWSHIAATTIFGIAGFTDWLDGYLARKWEQTSSFGAFLDPVADKLMVVIALIMLIDVNPTPYAGMYIAIPAAIIIGREITISALREWMAGNGERSEVAVAFIGKIKTAAQMLALGFLLYHKPLLGLPIVEIGMTLLYIAAVLTLWSMVVYLHSAWSTLIKD